MSELVDQDFFARGLAAVPVMAILRGLDRETTLAAATLAWDAGIRLVEVPVQDAEAVAVLTELAVLAHARGTLVGAGTVTSVERLELARTAGAAFTVAPGFDPEVAHASVGLGLPHLPGVATSTEVQHALRAGFGWLKAFPAADLGAGWIAAQLAPFPQARFVATGGIDLDNAEAFLAAGAAGVSLGSALAAPEQLRRLPALLARVRARSGLSPH